MKRSRIRLATTVVLGSATMVACAGSTPASDAGNPAPASGPDLERLEALYQARADSARLNISEADVAFMTGMIHHHAQALVMSAMAPTNGASPSLRTLTGRIMNAQKDEIGLMQRWLRDRNRAVPEVAPDGRMQSMGEHGMHMPGMLSAEQLDSLAVAQGPAFDRLFLTYMIQHHEGAVNMVHELFAADGAAQDEFVFKLASDIQVDQTTEVARMRRMLDALPPAHHP